MRLASAFAVLILTAGCSGARWQVISGPNNSILLDPASGKTWIEASYLPPGQTTFVPYWQEMKRGEAATRPSTGG